LDRSTFASNLVIGQESTHEGNMLDMAAQHGVKPLIIPFLGREISFWNDLRATLALWRLMRKYRPLIVHTHTSKAGFSGRLAAHLAGIPIVVHTFHGHVFSGYFGPVKTWIFILLERILAHWSSAIITISSLLKEQLLQRKIAPAEKIEVIELGLDLEPYLSLSGRSNLLREEMGLPTACYLVGIVGRLVPIKDHRSLLDAAKFVSQEDPMVRFVIVGDGELRAELEQIVRKSGLDKTVYFAGWRKDLAPIYAGLDLVVLSSKNEGTPVSIIEGSAAGKPIVATRVGGVPDMITHDWDGLLVPPENPRALADAILRIRREPRLGEVFAERARNRIAEKHSIDRLIQNMEALYFRLMKQKGIYIQGISNPADKINTRL
jgi:glycosyltransferase involved in cell wall biosynthesis